ncbi:uncharacterized protein LOC110441210 [Mizuhopecten yessoensis]|uniref:uncharacterized protein LOC110441210 n=1 Tax=Mizuhopecten yessoensis TaxID=6573 RepID=UPI000B45C0F4|nr:uncharacterized protein LOC110441210 [Mizuhopecten yessoensis]
MYTNLSGEMKTAHCEEQHFPICKKGKGKGDLDLFVNKTDDLQKMSWKDANSFCRKHGGVLADLSDGVGSLKGRWEDLTQSPPSSMFWIALNRANTTTKLLMENSTLGNSSRCLYIRKELRESKNCSQRAFASCRKNMNVTQIPDSTPSPAIDSKPSTADNSTPSIADNRTPSPATKPIIIYIVIPSVVVVIAVIGTVIFILARKRKKTSRALQHETRQQYDYTEIGGGQTPGRFGLQMQVVETSTNAASGSGLNIETHGYETETMDEGNYDKLDKKSNIKQKSNVCESNAYERAFPMQDGIYNEMQTGTDNGKEGARDSFYATAQSCSTREGNYDEFQKRNMSTGAEGAESDYDHVIHKTD